MKARLPRKISALPNPSTHYSSTPILTQGVINPDIWRPVDGRNRVMNGYSQKVRLGDCLKMPSNILILFSKLRAVSLRFALALWPPSVLEVRAWKEIRKNIAFARGGAHLPIAHALRLLSTKELRFGLTKLNLRKNNFLK